MDDKNRTEEAGNSKKKSVVTNGCFLVSDKKGAVEALALPSENSADLIQAVGVPAGTRVQRSRASPTHGRRGGGEQFQLLDKIPNENFGPGFILN